MLVTVNNYTVVREYFRGFVQVVYSENYKQLAFINTLLQSWLTQTEKAFQQLAGTLNFVENTIPFGKIFSK